MSIDSICRPKRGEIMSGDSAGVWQDETATLATVIDGLGSGQDAAEAAQWALACVEANREKPISDIMGRCHEAVRGTRGVVMALVRIEHRRDRLTFVGVGNIGFSAASAKRMQPISKSGLVGYRLPALLEFSFGCSPGDLIVLYSDGIASQFIREGGARVLNGTSPEGLAQQVARQFGKESDDVAVVTLRVMGDPGGNRDPGSSPKTIAWS